MRSALMTLAAAALIAGCSSGSSGTDTRLLDAGPDQTTGDAQPGDGPVADKSNATSTTIFALTDGTVSEGSLVLLDKVVVTAVDTYGSYTGDVIVQDEQGGPGSGIRLYLPAMSDGGQVTDLKVGDRVQVEGRYVQWKGPASSPFTDEHVDEIVSGSITFVASGTPPTPTVVQATDLTDTATSKGWKHVLVQVKNLSVISNVDSYGQVEVSGGLEIDDEFVDHGAALGDCLDVTGIPWFFYMDTLQPRSAADIQTSTGCIGPVKLTIKDLQDTGRAEHPAVGTRVTVEGVITAVDAAKDSAGDYAGFYIQEPSGGPYSGIYVYHKFQDSSTPKPELGHLVELTGTYDEYYDVSELKNVTWIDKGQGTIPAPAVVQAADLVAGGATAEPYEGVLVQVQGIEVGAYLSDASMVQIGFTDKTTGLPIIHKLYDFMAPTPPAIGTVYTSITGPVTYVTMFEIEPRSSADMVQ